MADAICPGVGRYRVLGLLGEGAHGRVFRVQQADTGAVLALKRLRPNVGRSSDLKREFRLVADLSHPNLVLPHALESDGEDVFFTMELIDGEPILDWLARFDAPEKEQRIRDAFRQLSEGVLALHRRGLVHRDIKPSNVLVGETGRVAVLDFGLTRSAESISHVGLPYYVDGTPAYAAPEILWGQPASPASDAYSVGVLLHQALTGRLPFHERVEESVCRRVLETEAPPLAVEPADLAELCRGLLAPKPSHRLTLEEVVRASSPRPHALAHPRRPVIVERDRELEALEGAWRRVAEEKRTEIVRLPGRSGMGKSALLRAFASRMSSSAWVLEGRAYERDTVPYKALDAAMDQLAHRLSSANDELKRALAPADAQALRFLFPSLAEALGEGAVADETLDANVKRRRGTRALSELLSRIADRCGLVLLIDDLQWGDIDSARLLTDILTQQSPSLLLVLAYRSEELSAGAFLSHYERWAADHAPPSLTIPIEPLSAAGASRLAKEVSGRDDARAECVTREADGCPFIIEMLLSAPLPEDGRPHTLESVLAGRLETLSEAARRMLEAVCLAGRPIAREIVPFGPTDQGDAWVAWARLASWRLVRSSPMGNSVEPYHDRIRAAVTAMIGETDRIRIHGALGEAFAASSDSEAAATHLALAGENERALRHARIAARAAFATLAFDRAAELSTLALSCCPTWDLETRREITIERARALANAGRGAEAAPLFLQCAEQLSGLEALDLERQAMEQFLIAGRIDDGRPVMEQLLRSLGVWLPRSSLILDLTLSFELLWMLLRGPRLGTARKLTPRERLKLETFVSIGKGFAAYDPSIGSWFFVRAARWALEAGIPEMAVRGIAYVATVIGFPGTSRWFERALKWVTAGAQLAEKNDDHHGLAFCEVARGMVHCCAGDWYTALDTFDSAATALDEKFGASDWEADTAKNTSLFVLLQMGDIAEMEWRSTILVQEARRRGDRALEVEANLYFAFVALAKGDPSSAHRIIDRTIEQWTARGFHFQHWIATRFRTMARLYQRDAERAFSAIDEALPLARAGKLTSMQVARIEGLDLHGRAALALASESRGGTRARWMRRVRNNIRLLEREKRFHATAPARSLTAGLFLLEGDRASAKEALEASREDYEKAGMKTYAATLEWLAARVGGDAKREARSAAALGSCGIRDPESWAFMHLPVEL